MNENGKSTRRAGFTLIEVIVVIALIGIIAAAIGPPAMRQINGMRANATHAELERIRVGLLAYYEDVGRFPDELDGLGALILDGDPAWRGPYIEYSGGNPIEAVATDAFGESYVYDLSPLIISGGLSDLIVSSKGPNKLQDLGEGGEWDLSDASALDDLLLTVSRARIDRANRIRAESELDSLAAASQRYYFANAAFPPDLLDLSGGFIDAGVGDDAFIDGWNRDYLSAITAGTDTLMNIWSIGIDGVDDGGAGDDIEIVISTATLGGGSGSSENWDWSQEGDYALYLITYAQSALDDNPGLPLGSNNLDHYLGSLGLSGIFSHDEWGSRMKVNTSTREVYSPGPDGHGSTTADNIPPGVGP